MAIRNFASAYAKLLEEKNHPTDYETYVRNNADNFNAVAREKVQNTVTGAARQLSGYGSLSESLSQGGLADDGYSKYVKAKIQSGARSRLEEIEAERVDAEREARQDYLSYLDSHNASQQKILRDVTEKLTEKRVTDPLRIYEYAVESGLTADAAEAAYESVYRSVKNEIKSEMIAKVCSQEFTPEMAKAYAKSIGLKERDISEIISIAEKFGKSFERYSEDYIRYLESLGNQNTVTHKQ